jgi:hypothetical protein
MTSNLPKNYEGGAECRLQPTPALQEFPQLSRLHFFSARNQGLVADYLAYLRARHYAPTMQEGCLVNSICMHRGAPGEHESSVVNFHSQALSGMIFLGDSWVWSEGER